GDRGHGDPGAQPARRPDREQPAHVDQVQRAGPRGRQLRRDRDPPQPGHRSVSAEPGLLPQRHGGVLMTTMTDSTRRAARRTAWITMTAGAFALGACGDFDVLNTNAPTAEELTSSPTRSVLARAATGVFDGAFNDVGNEIIFYAIYGREGYHLLGNDPREYEEQVHGPPDPAGRHGGIWLGPYAAIRHINTYLRALENASGLTDEEIRASAGFAKTMKAWHMHRLAVRT